MNYFGVLKMWLPFCFEEMRLTFFPLADRVDTCRIALHRESPELCVSASLRFPFFRLFGRPQRSGLV